jgi:hypothetical protein
MPRNRSSDLADVNIGLIIAAAAMAFAGGCDGVITKGTEHHARAILPGDIAFRGLDTSADVGIDIFEYQLPPGLPTESAVSRIAAQIERGSCYRRVTDGKHEAQLRCENPYGSAKGAFEEYRIRVRPGSRRVVVMYGDFDSRVEIESYHEVAAVFAEYAEARSR